MSLLTLHRSSTPKNRDNSSPQSTAKKGSECQVDLFPPRRPARTPSSPLCSRSPCPGAVQCRGRCPPNPVPLEARTRIQNRVDRLWSRSTFQKNHPPSIKDRCRGASTGTSTTTTHQGPPDPICYPYPPNLPGLLQTSTSTCPHTLHPIHPLHPPASASDSSPPCPFRHPETFDFHARPNNPSSVQTLLTLFSTKPRLSTFHFPAEG